MSLTKRLSNELETFLHSQDYDTLYDGLECGGVPYPLFGDMLLAAIILMEYNNKHTCPEYSIIAAVYQGILEHNEDTCPVPIRRLQYCLGKIEEIASASSVHKSLYY